MGSSTRGFAMTERSLERDQMLVAAATAGAADPAALGVDDSLSYETGLEVEARSQWTYARRRFMRHRLAVVSLVILVVILVAGATAPWIAPYPFDGYDANSLEVGPTFHGGHVFGTDLLGHDYFSRVLYGIRT